MEEFSFEDADVVVHPMLTTPLPGSGAPRPSNLSASFHSSPGMLFGGSSHPVASGGVTRGKEGRNKGLRK
jgi:hypothetical protein